MDSGRFVASVTTRCRVDPLDGTDQAKSAEHRFRKMNPIAIYRVENRSTSKIESPAYEEYYWPGDPCELRGAKAGSPGEGEEKSPPRDVRRPVR